MPVHFACAQVDPAVAPEGQFSVYNAVAGAKALLPLTAGHPTPAAEERELLREIDTFFRDM
jgi:cephalosporin-C deacetylase